MNNVDISEKFGRMWKQSRIDAGKSQDYMAKALGVSKKTVQNWEAGYASPSQIMGFKWFEALDVPALPYYLHLLYDEFNGISKDSSDEDVKKALIKLIENLDAETVRKILFLLYGDHGSPVQAIVDLTVAYVHTPLPARLGVADLVLTNYEIATAYKITQDHIRPNTEYLHKSIDDGKKAVAKLRKSHLGGDLE